VLDNADFSSIIYIWYEGGRLRPRVVKSPWVAGKRWTRDRIDDPTQAAVAIRQSPLPSGGTMAKKAKKAAKKKAKKK
jgi:hypothetical protein